MGFSEMFASCASTMRDAIEPGDHACVGIRGWSFVSFFSSERIFFAEIHIWTNFLTSFSSLRIFYLQHLIISMFLLSLSLNLVFSFFKF